MLRPSERKINELREIKIETNINKYAEGSCLISCGGTKVAENMAVGTTIIKAKIIIRIIKVIILHS